MSVRAVVHGFPGPVTDLVHSVPPTLPSGTSFRTAGRGPGTCPSHQHTRGMHKAGPCAREPRGCGPQRAKGKVKIRCPCEHFITFQCGALQRAFQPCVAPPDRARRLARRCMHDAAPQTPSGRTCRPQGCWQGARRPPPASTQRCMHVCDSKCSKCIDMAHVCMHACTCHQHAQHVLVPKSWLLRHRHTCAA